MTCRELIIGIYNHIGLNNLVIILGFFVVPSLGYYFIMKAYRLQQSISAYRVFKETFIHTLQEIKRGDISFIQILQNNFPIHEKAMKTFIGALDGKSLNRFNEKWREYEETYEKWGNFKEENPNAIFATNIQDMIEIAKNASLPKGFRADLKPFLQDDIANKKYLEYLILEILEITKKK